MLIYLCGPIDQCKNSLQVMSWRIIAKEKLQKAGFNIYDAASAFTIGSCNKDCMPLYNINEVALKESDALFVHFPKVITVGTPVELHMAYEQKKPIYAAIAKELWNSMVLTVLTKGGKVSESFNEVLDALIEDLSEGRKDG